MEENVNLGAFTSAEQTTLNNYTRVNEMLKELEVKKKELSEQIKTFMINKNISECVCNGHKLQIIDSTRTTVSKKTKDQFVAELINMNKKYLVEYTIEPNTESIFAEVDAGTLDKDFVDKYVKVTPIKTLRCS
jgi:tRNA U55 pseudouridine synthase TruB